MFVPYLGVGIPLERLGVGGHGYVGDRGHVPGVPLVRLPDLLDHAGSGVVGVGAEAAAVGTYVSAPASFSYCRSHKPGLGDRTIFTCLKVIDEVEH